MPVRGRGRPRKSDILASSPCTPKTPKTATATLGLTPRGSDETSTTPLSNDPGSQGQRGRGRPPGSKNKIKPLLDERAEQSWLQGGSQQKLIQQGWSQQGGNHQKEEKLNKGHQQGTEATSPVANKRPRHDENDTTNLKRDVPGKPMTDFSDESRNEVRSSDGLSRVDGVRTNDGTGDGGKTVQHGVREITNGNESRRDRNGEAAHVRRHNDQKTRQDSDNASDLHGTGNATASDDAAEPKSLLAAGKPITTAGGVSVPSRANMVAGTGCGQKAAGIGGMRSLWVPTEVSKRLVNAVCITDVTSDTLTITVRESSTCDGFFRQSSNEAVNGVSKA